MLTTFVIALREGVEASLIVSIIAAFLKRNDRSDALRWVFTGVLLACGLCLAGGVALRVLEQRLPARQQEGLETIVGLIAVGFVSYMVIWMRRHARSMRSVLEKEAGSALAQGSVVALVCMSFFAVMREGFETAVFLLAVFQNSNSTAAGIVGAVLGLTVAVAVGYGIYRGGVQLNLAKFFRVTGIVLVLVAAGLVASAAHSAHNAGWLNVLQSQALDLSAIIRPNSILAALVTGMLGIRPKPTDAEVIGWLIYLVPVGLYVLWPQGRKAAPPDRSTRQVSQPVAS